jgi:DNA (cytosine-5)-methyltransferase 1
MIPIAFHATQDPISGSVSPALGANMYAGVTHTTYIPMAPIPFDTTQISSPHNYSKPESGNPCHPLAAGAHPPAIAQPIGFDAYNNSVTGDVSKTLDTGQDYHHVPNVMQTMAVRRLTPVEWERLQGFPDNYTNIRDNCPDGPRYKALGNSMAVPVMRWIGERIEAHPHT